MPLIKVERYTLQQRIEIVKIHYKNGENFAETVCKVKSFLWRLGDYFDKQNCRIWGKLFHY